MSRHAGRLLAGLLALVVVVPWSAGWAVAGAAEPGGAGSQAHALGTASTEAGTEQIGPELDPAKFATVAKAIQTLHGALATLADEASGEQAQQQALFDLRVLLKLDDSRWPGDALGRKVARHLARAMEKTRPAGLDQLIAAVEQNPDEWLFTYYPVHGDRFHAAIMGQIEAEAGDFAYIRLVKSEEGLWQFSPQTVKLADVLYLATEDIDRDKVLAEADPEAAKREAEERARLEAQQKAEQPYLRQFMPEELKEDWFFSMEYWQWIGLFVVILVGVIVDYTLRFLLRVMTQRLIAGQNAQAKRETLVKTMRPLGLTAAAMVWMGLLLVLSLPEVAEQALLAATHVFAVLTATWGAWKIVDLGSEVLSTKAAKTSTKFDDVLIPLVRKALKIFIVAFGIIFAAHALNIPVIPMLTGLGIGGVAFAFAAKDTVENFFGSVAVLLDRPFDVGDWVVIGDTEGIVEEVGFRSTRVRTFYNSQVTVPNANLVRATVDNYGRRRYRRWKATVGIQYDTPPEKIVAFTEGIREIIRAHPYTRKDYFQVWLTGFGSSSLDILLYIFHEVPDWSTELRERERLILDVIRLADQLGVEFAFPTQTVHLFRGEKSTEPDHEPPRSMTDRRAQVEGIHTAQRLMKEQPWTKSKPGPVVFQDGPSYVEIDPETGQPLDPDVYIEDTRAGS